MNPFLETSCPEKLQMIFAPFAEGVEIAARKLSQITGASMPDLEGKMPQYLADGFVAECLIKRTAIEDVLMNAFNYSSRSAYLALLDMEREEKELRPYPPEKAGIAMRGIEELHALSKALPLIYRQLSQVPNPVLAAA